MCGAVVPTDDLYDVDGNYYVLIPDVWGGCSNSTLEGTLNAGKSVLIPDVWGGCSNFKRK